MPNTIGNKYIDKFIQEAQLKAGKPYEVIEWISYNRLRNIKYLIKGGFSIIYKAIWLDGYIISPVKRYYDKLNNKDYEIAKEKEVKSPLNEDEVTGCLVALKSLNNSSNINDDFLNEVSYFL
jgi:hypothetical protein